MFEYTAIQRLMRLCFDALLHLDIRDTVGAWVSDEDAQGWELEFRLSLQQAGFFDGSRDAHGFHIGEGFIRHDGLQTEIDQVKIYCPHCGSLDSMCDRRKTFICEPF